MWCCRYVDRCPSLLCDIFDLLFWTRTYRYSHLSKNGGGKVVHLIHTRGVSWSLPVSSIKKTRNSQGNLKKILFKVLTIGFYIFFPSFRQIMDTIPKKLFLLQGKPFDEPFFDFFKIGEALLCEWVSHRCDKVIAGRGEVWRVRRVR